MYHCSISSFSSLHSIDFASLIADVAYMTSTVNAIQSTNAPKPLPANEYILGSLVQYTDNKTIMLRSMKKMPYIKNDMPAPAPIRPVRRAAAFANRNTRPSTDSNRTG